MKIYSPFVGIGLFAIMLSNLAFSNCHDLDAAKEFEEFSSAEREWKISEDPELAHALATKLLNNRPLYPSEKQWVVELAEYVSKSRNFSPNGDLNLIKVKVQKGERLDAEELSFLFALLPALKAGKEYQAKSATGKMFFRIAVEEQWATHRYGVFQSQPNAMANLRTALKTGTLANTEQIFFLRVRFNLAVKPESNISAEFGPEFKDVVPSLNRKFQDQGSMAKHDFTPTEIQFIERFMIGHL